MNKFRTVAFKFADIIVLLTMVLSGPFNIAAVAMQDPAPALGTDKVDYAPGESAYITGVGFLPGDYKLSVSGPDGTLDWGTVTADESGGFASGSPALVSAGAYELSALAADGTMVASVGFSVTAPPEPTQKPTAEPTTEPTQEPTPLPTPFIQSDKLDYVPGELVTLAGGNWQGDTQVRIFVNDDIGQSWSRDVIVDVAPDGTVVDSFYLPAWFVATYIVSAGGQQTGRVVTTIFTDAPLPASVKAVTWETKPSGGWIQGTLNANNSDYKEGETVPFRVEMSGNTVPESGNPWYAPICRDYANTPTGPYGYTILQPFNTSRSADPGGTIINSVGAFSGVRLTILQVYDPGASSGTLDSNTFNCGSTQRLVIVKFNATGSGNADRYLLWGGRLSKPGDTNPNVAFGNSSSNYPGGSLQMRLASPDKTAGIQPGAIIQLAKITVTKVVDSGSATPDQWCFTVVGPNNYNVTQCVPSGQSSVDFVGLQTGTYTPITESSVAGYAFSGNGPNTNCTFNGSTATATVTAAAGGATNASCTFHNALQQGTLTVIKHVVNDNGGTATSGQWSIHVKSGSNEVSGSPQPGSETGTTYTLTSGAYTVSETDGPSGYAFTGFSGDCDSSGNVTVVAGQNKTCTLNNNDQTAHLKLVKTVTNDNGGTAVATDWTLSAAGPTPISGAGGAESDVNAGTYTLSETSLPGYTAGSWSCSGGTFTAPDKIVLALGQSATCTINNDDIQPKLIVIKQVNNGVGTGASASDFTMLVTGIDVSPASFPGAEAPGIEVGLDAGNYSVSENMGSYAGQYDATYSADCTGSIGIGEIKTCTVTNTRRGQIIFKKETLPDGSTQLFDFTSNFMGTFKLSDGQSKTSGWLIPGTYSVSEIVPTNWDLTSATCDDGSNPGSIGLSVGETVTCTFENTQRAIKSGYKWHDLDADGVKDADEPVLSGWTIQAWQGETKVAETTTNASGQYTFYLKPGTYTIKEVCPAGQGWRQSWPVPNAYTTAACGTGVYNVTLSAGQVDNDNNFGNYKNATKTGTKFHDWNANGYWDENPNEPRLPNWTIVALQQVGETWVEVATIKTNVQGNYSFSLKPGSYVICEQLQEGWLQSRPYNATVDPNQPTSYWAACPVDGYGPFGWRITLTSGITDSNNNFGNYQLATKSGYKFEDLNANGIKDTGEPGLGGWTINYVGTVGPLGGTYTVSGSTTTGSDGYYEFKLRPGVYTITETLQPGWTCSYPTGCKYDVTLISQQIDNDNNFGNWYPATKKGMKFEDENADGDKDADELGLSGWTIQAWQGATKVAETTTDSEGKYVISGLKPGTYTFKEVNDSGWTCSYPNPCEWIVTLKSRQVDEGNDFGNWYPAKKSGMKFEDLNANGVKDSGELGLSGWKIYVDYNDNNTWDDGEPFAITGSGGLYTITGIKPGTWYVREVAQSGWICSFPKDCQYSHTFTSSDILTGNDFGNWYPGTKSGMKFEDKNGNHLKDSGEPGLSGWTIYVDYNDNKVLDDGEPNAVTGPDGTYSITGIKPGTWYVREVAQPMWICTFPKDCQYQDTFISRTVKTGNNFGNYPLPPSQATNSSLCIFDRDPNRPGQQFRSLFNQDPQNWPQYRMNATNPGQFFYNVFATGNPGDQLTFEITLPYPFVTQGANPVHGYGGVDVYTNDLGQTCFMPESEFFVSSQQVVLGDYTNGTYENLPGGTDGNGGDSVGTYSFDVTVTVPSSGFVYVNVHLDYGLKGSSGYYTDGLGNAVANSTSPYTYLVPQLADHTFSVSGDQNDTSMIENWNEFKKNPGVGGFSLLTDADGTPVVGATVTLKKGNTVIGTAITDEDGWYQIVYKHTGKAADFTVTISKVPGKSVYTQTKTVTLKANAYFQVNFDIPK